MVLSNRKPDWLVVDHYAIDQKWEEALAGYYRHQLVIDDLADLPHSSILLIDQNLGRQPHDFSGLVPKKCQVLSGPRHALLRSECAELQPYSLKRRQTTSALHRILITMGGADQTNATQQVLNAVKTCSLPAESSITVVMILKAPSLKTVRLLIMQMPWPT